MTHEVNSSTIDHRHPELASIALKIVGTATAASAQCDLPLRRTVDAATQAMFSHEDGEHREVSVAAIAEASGVHETALLAVYDQPVAEKAPRTLKKFLASEESPAYDIENLIDAIVRFEACHHVNLVKKFVSQFVSRQDPDILNRSADELFTYGYVGLSNALRSYDPTTNTISTFSNFRIVGAVRDGIRSESPVPKRLTTFVRAVESVEESLTKSLARIPTHAEVEEALGDQSRYLHLYPRLARQASLDEITSYNPVSEDNVEDLVTYGAVGADIQEEVANLDEVERVAVQLIHADGLSARMASNESGIAQSQLTRAAESGLAKLRQAPRLQRWQDLVAA